jgi:pyruvate ferredoxin oxidoreductase delta subunit
MKNENLEKPIHQRILASEQRPVVGECGKTGTWRTQRPVINLEKCTCAKNNNHSCHICWLFCPDFSVSRDTSPIIDYDYCKGCGICAAECPVKAIEMVPEYDKEGAESVCPKE